MAATVILAVGRIVGGDVHLNVAPPVAHSDTVLAATGYGRRLFNDGASRAACIGRYELAGWDEAAAEVDALIDEVMGKPNLGIEDSAGLVDYAAELDDLIEARLDNEYHASGAW